MVSDEFKQMIKEESKFKIEKRILHLKASMHACKKVMAVMKDFDERPEKALFDEAQVLYNDNKDKMLYCKRVLILKNAEDKELEEM